VPLLSNVIINDFLSAGK